MENSLLVNNIICKRKKSNDDLNEGATLKVAFANNNLTRPFFLINRMDALSKGQSL